MDFFTTIQTRRSVRKYTATPIPEQTVMQALEAAFLAPNSSNAQTARIYWTKSQDIKGKIVTACLDQSAARTAQELFVVVSDRKLVHQARLDILSSLKTDSPKQLRDYYEKLIPFLYGYTWLAPMKWLIFNLRGLVKPTPRKPCSARDIDEVCIKSAALVSENLMLAFTALGFDTCPMEGFDEARVKRALNLSRSSRVVMVISAGKRDPSGIWGEQRRLPLSSTLFVV